MIVKYLLSMRERGKEEGKKGGRGEGGGGRSKTGLVRKNLPLKQVSIASSFPIPASNHKESSADGHQYLCVTPLTEGKCCPSW